MKTKTTQYEDLYNEQRKNLFLKSYEDENTVVNYRYVLAKIYQYEERFGKDVCDFNYKDLDVLFHGLNAKSVQSIAYQVSVIQKYIKFCIEEGFSNNSINYATLSTFSGSNLEVYVNTIWKEKRIMSREDIYKTIIEETENAQDGVIFSLLFEGVHGEELSELINLRQQDVDELNNRLKLVDKYDNKREIVVPGECISIIKDALDQSEYEKTIVSDEGRVYSETTILKDSDHVLKLSQRKKSKDQITAQAIRQRFKKIKDYYKNPYLTPSSVRLSGMIDMAYNIVKNEGLNSVSELTTDHYKTINVQYGINLENHYQTKLKIKQHISE